MSNTDLDDRRARLDAFAAQPPRAAERITEDGEIVPNLPAISDTAGLTAVVRAELDVQIITARQFPRSLKRVIGNITTLATLDEETADECLYALVRKKKGARDEDEQSKPIEGPSIRLAEIAAQCYGNCRIEARVIQVNRYEKFVEAEGIFHDLETNMASKATVRRRISTKKGFVFGEDMINVTANAACAIAKRNAILAGIPRGVYRPAYNAARAIVAGTAETLVEKRSKAVAAFAHFGVKPQQLFDALEVGGETEITTDHIATMRGMFQALKNSEATVEEMFPKPASGEKIKESLQGSDVDQRTADENPVSAARSDSRSGPEDGSDSGGKRQASEPSESSGVPSTAAAGAKQDPVRDAEDHDRTSSAARSDRDPQINPADQSRTGGAAPPTGATKTTGASPATRAKPSDPRAEGEYVAHAETWIRALTDAATGDDRWKREKAIRNHCNVDPDVRDKLYAALQEKIADLKKKDESANVERHDQDLATAAKSGTPALDAAIANVPEPHRTTLKVAIERRHRPAAAAVDVERTRSGEAAN